MIDEQCLAQCCECGLSDKRICVVIMCHLFQSVVPTWSLVLLLRTIPLVIWHAAVMLRTWLSSPFRMCHNLTGRLTFSEACGGAARTSVYSMGEVVAFPVPSPQKDNLPGNYTYAGCLQ